MEIIKFQKKYNNDTIDLIKKCYIIIKKEFDIEGKDNDLLDIENHYNNTNGAFFIAINDEKVVGTVGIVFLNEKNIIVGDVRRLYVLPELQNLGIGTALLKFIYKYAKNNQANCLRGVTSKSQEKAISLYKKLGAHEISQYRKSQAELFFEKEIVENTNSEKLITFSNEIKSSFTLLEQYNKESLILNPVENYPSPEFLTPCASTIHGLYNTDSIRNESEKKQSKIQFSGRELVLKNVNEIYNEWSNLLGAEALTMRLLSGLHAHIVLFMSITDIGDRVLLLPEIAGGHMATKAILERLGLEVKELPIDIKNRKVNKEESLNLIREFDPKVIFVDRSEGLVYEDFSWINKINKNTIKIFDASQYITNILSGDYSSPFDMGFDMILSTMHKNLPGPQRALICCRIIDDNWRKLKSGISTYVSNMHFHSIYSAGLLLKDYSNLKNLSKNMLNNTVLLDRALADKGINVIKRNTNASNPSTHHIWLKPNDKEQAYTWYKELEEIGILTNYRKLPYELGYGLRLGLSAASYRGLNESHISALANIIADCLHNKDDKLNLKKRLKQLLMEIDNGTQ